MLQNSLCAVAGVGLIPLARANGLDAQRDDVALNLPLADCLLEGHRRDDFRDGHILKNPARVGLEPTTEFLLYH